MNLDEYLKQLETLVNIDCGSRNIEGLNKVADYLSKWYQDINWQVKRHELSNGTCVLEISNHENCDHYDAMFIGHMDTVFPDGTVKQRPFRREGNICYGPGVEDMKSGDLAMLHIAKNLDKKTDDSLNICMCYNPDEEIGSRLSAEVTQKIAAISDRVFVMESAQEDGGHVFNRKGKVDYVLEFEGIGAHAGFMFDTENASAIEELGHYIVELSKLKDREKETSVNVGVVSGGSSVNTVAAKARLELEARFLTKDERDRIVESVEKLINNKPFTDNVKVKITDHFETPVWVQTEKGKEYIKHVSDIASKMNIPFIEKKRGGLSDANRLCEVCDIILDGMGPYGKHSHSDKEFMDIDSVEPCVNLFLKVLDDLV